jgi:hypothetical protein
MTVLPTDSVSFLGGLAQPGVGLVPVLLPAASGFLAASPLPLLPFAPLFAPAPPLFVLGGLSAWSADALRPFAPWSVLGPWAEACVSPDASAAPLAGRSEPSAARAAAADDAAVAAEQQQQPHGALPEGAGQPGDAPRELSDCDGDEPPLAIPVGEPLMEPEEARAAPSETPLSHRKRRRWDEQPAVLAAASSEEIEPIAVRTALRRRLRVEQVNALTSDSSFGGSSSSSSSGGVGVARCDDVQEGERASKSKQRRASSAESSAEDRKQQEEEEEEEEAAAGEEDGERGRRRRRRGRPSRRARVAVRSPQHASDAAELQSLEGECARTRGFEAKRASGKAQLARPALALCLGGDEASALPQVQGFRAKRVCYRRRDTRGWALFALERVERDEPVMELVGELLRAGVAALRAEARAHAQPNASLLFRFAPDTVLDATRAGNLACFLGTACEPNCAPRLVRLDERPRALLLFARRGIAPGEALTVHCGFAAGGRDAACRCARARHPMSN